MLNSCMEGSSFKIGLTLLIQLLQCKSVLNVIDSIMYDLFGYKFRKQSGVHSYIIIEKIYMDFVLLHLIEGIPFLILDLFEMGRGKPGDLLKLAGKVLNAAITELIRYFIQSVLKICILKSIDIQGTPAFYNI